MTKNKDTIYVAFASEDSIEYNNIPLDIERIETCPLCGGAEHTPYKTDHPLEGEQFRNVDYVQCPCGMVFMDWFLTEDSMREFYRELYHLSKTDKSAYVKLANIDRESHKAMELMEILDGEVPEIHDALDVGSSTGVFLRILRNKYKCNITGVEPSIHFREYSIMKDTPTYPYLEFVPEKQKFDFVAVLSTLEHIPRPMEMLRQITSRMTEDGYLFIEINDHEKYRFLHPVAFTEETLVRALDAVGHSVKYIQCGDFIRTISKKERNFNK